MSPKKISGKRVKHSNSSLSVNKTMTSNKKKDKHDTSVVKQGNIDEIDAVKKHKKVKKKLKNNDTVNGDKSKPSSVDAFQILMGAHKRVIGANSPGKERMVDVDESDAKSIEKSVKTKRKLFLERWADSKGSSEKKIIEEEQEKKAKRTLKIRKKNFKDMLMNKNKENKNKSNDIIDSSKNFDVFNNTNAVHASKRKKKTTLRKHRKIESGSDSEMEFVNKKVCLQIESSNDSDEFIKNLAPSIKKKENVLSYFKKMSKTEDPKTNCDSKKVDDKKKSTNSKVSKKNKTVLPSTELQAEDSNSRIAEIDNEDTAVNSNLRNRVKRLTKKPIKYIQSDSSDSDVNVISDESPGEQNETQNVYFDPETQTLFIEDDKVVSPIKIVNIKNPDIRCVKSPKPTKNGIINLESKEKIAPLFLKKSSKQSIDPTIAAARLKFLYSETPMVIQKRIDVDVSEFIIIPEISHVQQIPTENDDDYYIWNLTKPETVPKLKNDASDITDTLSKTSFFDTFQTTPCNIAVNRNNSELFGLFNISDHKEILKSMKELYPKFPTYKTFRQLKEKFDTAESNRRLSIDDDVCVEIIETNSLENDLLNKNHENELWTDKYKPLCSDDIIGNFKSIASLKKWLISWKECSQDMSNKLKTRVINDDTSSSDDFFTSDSDSSDHVSLPNNTTIIVGPKGSGKTSAVYAIANELDVNILEVNASSKRTGKRIMAELQEATQSHKLSTKKKFEDFTKSSGSKKKKTEKQKSKSKKPFFKNGEKPKSIHENGINKSNEAKKMSLMLIDDADVVFDEDDGFISAVNHIIGISKRPIVIITSDLRCNHLKKIISDNNVIKFSPHLGKIIGPWLDVMLLVECGKFFPNLSSRLVDFNKGDMRMTMLQLQFWLSNKSDIWKDVDTTNKPEYEENNFDMNEESNMSWIYASKLNDASNSNQDRAINEILENMTNITKTDNTYHLEIENDDNTNRIDSVSNLLDSLSIVDVICGRNDIENRINYPWHTELGDSLSELENDSAYDERLEFSKELRQHVIHQSIELTKGYNKNLHNDNILDKRLEEIRWRNKHHYVHSRLANIVPMSSQLDRSGLTLDYMPSLRDVCRMEKFRSESNVKRNNRFYHYLRSLNANVNDSTYKNACDVLKFNFE